MSSSSSRRRRWGGRPRSGRRRRSHGCRRGRLVMLVVGDGQAHLRQQCQARQLRIATGRRRSRLFDRDGLAGLHNFGRVLHLFVVVVVTRQGLALLEQCGLLAFCQVSNSAWRDCRSAQRFSRPSVRSCSFCSICSRRSRKACRSSASSCCKRSISAVCSACCAASAANSLRVCNCSASNEACAAARASRPATTSAACRSCSAAEAARAFSFCTG